MLGLRLAKGVIKDQINMDRVYDEVVKNKSVLLHVSSLHLDTKNAVKLIRV